MKDDKEKLSAYLDDAADHADMSNLTDSTGVSTRYQLIGEAMRGNISDVAMIDVSEQVRQAIQGEDAPRVDVSLASSKNDRRNQYAPRKPWLDLTDWMRPLTGFAMAASIALMMVVTVTQFDSTNNSTNGVGGQLADGSSAQSVNATLVASDTRMNVRPVNSTDHSLDNYLEMHSEFAAQETMQGRMPYVRAVSYESN